VIEVEQITTQTSETILDELKIDRQMFLASTEFDDEERRRHLTP